MGHQRTPLAWASDARVSWDLAVPTGLGLPPPAQVQRQLSPPSCGCCPRPRAPGRAAAGTPGGGRVLGRGVGVKGRTPAPRVGVARRPPEGCTRPLRGVRRASCPEFAVTAVVLVRTARPSAGRGPPPRRSSPGCGAAGAHALSRPLQWLAGSDRLLPDQRRGCRGHAAPGHHVHHVGRHHGHCHHEGKSSGP